MNMAAPHVLLTAHGTPSATAPWRWAKHLPLVRCKSLPCCGQVKQSQDFDIHDAVVFRLKMLPVHAQTHVLVALFTSSKNNRQADSMAEEMGQ